MRGEYVPPTHDDARALLARHPLFRDLDAAVLADLAASLEWSALPGGAPLVMRGPSIGGAYLVLHGKLRAVSGDGRVSEVGADSMLGAWALANDEPRALSASALRDTEVAKLSRDAFAAAAARAPELHARLASELASTSGGTERCVRHVAVVPADPDTPLDAFFAALGRALSARGRTLLLDRVAFDAALGPGAADDDIDIWDQADRRILAWIGARDREHDVVLYRADAVWSAWTKRCVRQSETVLVVARAGAHPRPSGGEREVLGTRRAREGDVRLVLLHDATTREPSATPDWLHHRPAVRAVHHVRVDRDDHHERLARYLTASAVGLVLGGGGARGQAHIGVVRALRECGVPIDAAGGTSAGGGIAALTACEWEFDAMKAAVHRAFVVMAPFAAVSVPFHSLMHKPAVEAPARFLGGDRWIEDLWIPFFCVSCDIRASEKVVHRRGRLWKALCATTALPGVLPPVVMRGKVLVDGGVVDNMPVDPMRETTDGPVILVDVSPPEQELLGKKVLDLPVNGDVIVSHLHPLLDPITVPNLVTVVISTMTMADAVRRHDPPPDLVVRPDVAGYGMTEFEAQEELIALGYNATLDSLAGASDAALARLGITRADVPGARMEVPRWLGERRRARARLVRAGTQSGLVLSLGLAAAALAGSMVGAGIALALALGVLALAAGRAGVAIRGAERP